MTVVEWDLAQLRALSAAVSAGSFDGAARALHVTPSAISQRIRALEVTTGRVLLVRSRPVRVTASGSAVLRLARQVELLAAETTSDLGVDDAGTDQARSSAAAPTRLQIAVNADSLATWVLPALAPLAGQIAFDLHREDQAHTAELLREGAVMAAVTADGAAVPGCSVTRLGSMRYRPVAAPAFVSRWLPDGPTLQALGRAPVVVFDRKDDLQAQYLSSRGSGEVLSPPAHFVPASADFLTAVRLGMGWGMLPDAQADELVDAGMVVVLDAAGTVDVPLHWQQWKLRSPALDQVAAAVLATARAWLLP